MSFEKEANDNHFLQRLPKGILQRAPSVIVHKLRKIIVLSKNRKVIFVIIELTV